MAVQIDNYHFVISAPRSGSTWLANALNHHPEILATENRLFGDFCQLWPNPKGKLSPRITADKYFRVLSQHSFHKHMNVQGAGQLQEKLLSEYFQFLAGFLRRQSGKSIVVDKVTPYLGTSQIVRDMIAKYFRNAKVVHLVRDGRDVAVSGVFDWVARENKDSVRFQKYVNGDDRPLTRFFDEDSLKTWAGYWADSFAAIDAAQVLKIRYEELLSDQADTLGKVFEYLELDYAGDIVQTCIDESSFETTTGRASGVDDPLAKARKGVAGDWTRYFTRADAELFQQLVGDRLDSEGYQTDANWVQDCPESLSL